MDGGDGVQQVMGSNGNKSAQHHVDVVVGSSSSAAAAAAVPEAKTARTKKGKRSRPQSAPSKISRSPNPNPAGADTATRPRSSNRKPGGKTSRLGSRMREDVSKARSSSTPALHAMNNGDHTAKNINAGEDTQEEQGRRRLELSKGSTATVALGVDGDNAASSDTKKEDELLQQQMELRNQELQSRCRHLEQRCAHFEC